MQTSNAKILAGLLGLTMLGVIVLTENQKNERTAAAAASEAAKPPEQKAAEKAERERRDAQLQMAAMGAQQLKQASLDPAAFELTSLVLMPNGTACYDYRAKNAFGATLPSSAVLTSKGKLLDKVQHEAAFVAAWNKECTKPGGNDIAPHITKSGVL